VKLFVLLVSFLSLRAFNFYEGFFFSECCHHYSFYNPSWVTSKSSLSSSL
jgi:hypothetical protein